MATKKTGGATPKPAARKAIRGARRYYTKQLGPVAGKTAVKAARNIRQGINRGDSAQTAHAQKVFTVLNRRVAKAKKTARKPS